MDIKTNLDNVLIFAATNQIAIFFALGSIAVFFMIIFIDKLMQKKSIKHSLSNIQDEAEISKGIASVDRALQDKVINEEEYEKFKNDLINKEQE
jgi:hypothetical protein